MVISILKTLLPPSELKFLLIVRWTLLEGRGLLIKRDEGNHFNSFKGSLVQAKEGLVHKSEGQVSFGWDFSMRCKKNITVFSFSIGSLAKKCGLVQSEKMTTNYDRVILSLTRKGKALKSRYLAWGAVKHSALMLFACVQTRAPPKPIHPCDSVEHSFSYPFATQTHHSTLQLHVEIPGFKPRCTTRCITLWVGSRSINKIINTVRNFRLLSSQGQSRLTWKCLLSFN